MLNSPSAAYVDVILKGLMETYPERSELALRVYLYSRNVLSRDDRDILSYIRGSAHGVSPQDIAEDPECPCLTKARKSVKQLVELGLIRQDGRSVRAGKMPPPAGKRSFSSPRRACRFQTCCGTRRTDRQPQSKEGRFMMAVTKLLRIKQTKGSEPSCHLRRNINYICNPKKTDAAFGFPEMRDKDRWEQKKRLLSLAAYARQITFMVKYGIRTMEDLNAKKEETKELLRVANRRLSEGIGDRELLLAYRRNLLKRLRICDGIASENLSTQTVALSRDDNRNNIRI